MPTGVLGQPNNTKEALSFFLRRDFVQNKVIPELTELVTEFSPHLLFMDGDWQDPSDYWLSREFLAWLYNTR